MLTSLVDCEPGALAVGRPVRLVFVRSRDGTPVPCFRPVATDDSREPAAQG